MKRFLLAASMIAGSFITSPSQAQNSELGTHIEKIRDVQPRLSYIDDTVSREIADCAPEVGFCEYLRFNHQPSAYLMHCKFHPDVGEADCKYWSFIKDSDGNFRPSLEPPKFYFFKTSWTPLAWASVNALVDANRSSLQYEILVFALNNKDLRRLAVNTLNNSGSQ